MKFLMEDDRMMIENMGVGWLMSFLGWYIGDLERFERNRRFSKSDEEFKGVL